MAETEPRVELRERRTSDLEHCVSALRRVHDADGYPMAWPRDPVRWLSPARMLRGWVALARRGAGGGADLGAERVVGHVLLLETGTPGTVEIARLFVSPEGRGHGLGAALLDMACGWAGGQGQSVVLEVVAAEGSPAIALYERTGWRRTGTVTAEWTAPDGSCVELHRYIR